MTSLLMRIQEACLQLDTWYLVGPGLGLILVGLFLWLGGIRYAFLVVGILGATGGAVLGLLIGHWFGVETMVAVVAGAAITTILALLLQNLVIIGLAVILFGIVGGFSYLGYALDKPDSSDPTDPSQFSESNLTYANPGSSDVEVLVNYESNGLGADDSHTGGMQKLDGIRNEIKELASANRQMLLLCGAGGAVLGLLLGYLLKKVMMAICCSIIGTTGAVVGMLMLLLAKGTPVMMSLQDRPKLIPTIFVAMVVFGCLVQMILAGAKKIEKATEDEEDE
jgi:hypothetical protein